MKTFGVVGAGTMGSGIAQKIAMEGRPVTVVDLDQAALDRGRERIDSVFEESIQRKLMSRERAREARERIAFTTEQGDLSGADLIVEAVFENFELKTRLFRELEAVVPESTIIASNTSSFPITTLAEDLRHPERFIGLHFFYPAVKNRLLEIIPGGRTSRETLASARLFGFFLQKVDIRCTDRAGFVVNRFFIPWYCEAVRLLAEEAAPLSVIESTAKRGFGVTMGPFELMNATGLAVAAHAAEGLAANLGEFYSPDPLLTERAEKGPWEIEETEEFSEPVFRRLLAVAWTVAATLVQEGVAGPLQVDLGAQVGLRWPVGPFGLFNGFSPVERQAILDEFGTHHQEFPRPDFLERESPITLPGLSVEKPNGGVTLSLSRPGTSNALDGSLVRDLYRAVAGRSEHRTVVLRGKGKSFCAGVDVRFLLDRLEERDLDSIREFLGSLRAILKILEDRSGKVVAVLDGLVLGAGAELALACDVVAATPRARIGFPETGLGIVPALGWSLRLPRRVGKGLAAYLAGTGRILDGETAAAVGLVDACLPPEEMSLGTLMSIEPARKPDLPKRWAEVADFMERTGLEDLLGKSHTEPWQADIQKTLRNKAPLALRSALSLLEGSAEADREEALEAEMIAFMTLLATEDARVGLASVGGDAPEYRGK